MKEEIAARFATNLARVEHFIGTYDDLRQDHVDSGVRDDPRGRATVLEGDLLRAAVVFLHASLEDLVRSLVAWRFLDFAAPHDLAQVPLAGPGPRVGKLDLSHLASHRGSTVEQLLRASVDQWLEKQSYNHVGDLKAALGMIGVDKHVVDPFGPYLGPMIERRHWIVHRADRNAQTGRGQHSARTINAPSVRTWKAKVVEFGDAVLGAL